MISRDVTTATVKYHTEIRESLKRRFPSQRLNAQIGSTKLLGKRPVLPVLWSVPGIDKQKQNTISYRKSTITRMKFRQNTQNVSAYLATSHRRASCARIQRRPPRAAARTRYSADKAQRIGNARALETVPLRAAYVCAAWKSLRVVRFHRPMLPMDTNRIECELNAACLCSDWLESCSAESWWASRGKSGCRSRSLQSAVVIWIFSF